MNNNLKNKVYDDESLVSFESSMLPSVDNQSVNSDNISVNTSDVMSYKSNIDNQSVNSSANTADISNYKSKGDNQSVNSNNISINTADISNYKSNVDKRSINPNSIFNYKSNIDNPSVYPNNIYMKIPESLSDNPIKMLINNQIFGNGNDGASIPPHRTSAPNNIIDNKKIIIDVAVLCQEYTNVETSCDDNIINLEDIPVSMEHFQAIFYPYKDNFGINKDFMLSNKCLINLISFLPEHRIIQNTSKKFYLLEEIISNIERNLNISRNCFTKDSLVELTNEIISIKSLLDINCCSVLSSLSWDNVIEVIENYKFVSSTNNKNDEIIPVCVVNIVFKTPTTDVKNTTIRFNYKITNYK